MRASQYYRQIWERSLLLPVSMEDIINDANKSKQILVWRVRDMPEGVAGQLEVRGDTLWLFSNDKLSSKDCRLVFARFLVDAFNKDYRIEYSYDDIFRKSEAYFEALRILLPQKAITTLTTRCGVTSMAKLAEHMWIGQSHLHNLFVKDNILNFGRYFNFK